jgi:hypothetical protein
MCAPTLVNICNLLQRHPRIAAKRSGHDPEALELPGLPQA